MGNGGCAEPHVAKKKSTGSGQNETLEPRAKRVDVDLSIGSGGEGADALVARWITSS